MSTMVQDIVDQVSYDLLEPPASGGGPGLISGLITQQEVLDLLGEVLLDFCQQTSLTWDVFTQLLNAGVSQYLVPDRMSYVFYVFQNSRIVEKTDLLSGLLQGQWQRHPGAIKAYHQDGLPIKTVEVVPAPNWDGTNFVPGVLPPSPPPFGSFGTFQPGMRNLSFCGAVLPSQETWGIRDTLDGIPDSFTPYLVFGILERIFGKDGEAKDPQRALYCRARYQEGIGLARSILMDLLEEEEANKG